MPGYTKLFSSIVTSSLWQEDSDTKVVWITMLALKEKDGIVRTTIPGLARISGVSIEKTKECIEKFQQPDPYSRSQECEGRKIRTVDGGYFLINADKYRKLLNEEERREYKKLKQREYRQRDKQNKIHFSLEDFKNEGFKIGLADAESELAYRYASGRGIEIDNLSDWLVYWRNNKYKHEKPAEQKSDIPPVQLNAQGLTPRQEFLKNIGDPDYKNK